MEQGSNERQISAIRKLWGIGDIERKDGVAQLQALGLAAGEALVNLLEELVSDPRPRFPTGMERDGAEAVENYELAVQAHRDNESSKLVKIRSSQKRIALLAINSRLMRDSVHVLGKLKESRAVPVLLKIMNRRWSPVSSGNDVRGPESEALCEIGEAAVPELIHDLEETTIRSYGFERVVYGWSLTPKSECENSHDAEEEEQDESSDEDQVSCYIELARLRAVWVLGQIGDPRSVPALEHLMEQGIKPLLASAISDALTKIESRPIEHRPNDSGSGKDLPRSRPSVLFDPQQ